MDELSFKAPKKNNPTNRTDVYDKDDTWSLDIIDLKGFGPENKRNYRYALAVIDTFSKFGWTVPSENKSVRTRRTFLNTFSTHPKENHTSLKQTAEKNSSTKYLRIF